MLAGRIINNTCILYPCNIIDNLNFSQILVMRINNTGKNRLSQLRMFITSFIICLQRVNDGFFDIIINDNTLLSMVPKLEP